MNISMPANMVREIADKADAAIESARLSFVYNKGLTSEEWRRIMEIIIHAKVSCSNALRNDADD